MSLFNRYYRLFFIIILLQACAAGKSGEDKLIGEAGKVTEMVKCQADTSITFALYLPSDYDKKKQYPVIFAFDAHGNGSRAVELFRADAEQYGYIVIGSNNSKNGLPADASMRIWEVMSGEAFSNLSIDRNRVYTAGFSGGSRVASSIAIYKGGIAGVIGCSAGFPALNQPIQYKFDYIGFVGNEDMNYLEMLTLDDALEQAGYRHHLVIFNGTHDWPPVNNLREAFIWLEVNAMKDKKIPVDTVWVNATLKHWTSEAEKHLSTGSVVEAWKIYDKTISFLEGLTPLDQQKNEWNKLRNSDKIRQSENRVREVQQTELSLQTRYVRALMEKDQNWWKQEVQNLNTLSLESPEADSRAMYKRVLGYLSLACYSYSNGYLVSGDLNNAGRFITLYAIIDPANPEHAYMMAVLNARQDHADAAFNALEQAIGLGFNDLKRIGNDTAFNGLREDPRYKENLDKIQK